MLSGRCLGCRYMGDKERGGGLLAKYSSRAQKRRFLADILPKAKGANTEPLMDVESQGLVRDGQAGSSDRNSASILENNPSPPRPKGLKGFFEGPFVLLLVAFFWGTFSPALKGLYETKGPPDPAMLTAVRTTIQAGGLWVVALVLASQGFIDAPVKKQSPSKQLIWRAGIEMGFWNFVANSFQAYGLDNTTALRGGFIIAATSILTPLLAVAVGELPTNSVWVASVIALGSTMLVAADSSSSGTSEAVYGIISIGDAAVFASAFFYSVATVRLTHWAQQLPTMKLASTKSLTLAAFSILWLSGVAINKAFHGEDLKLLWAGAAGLNAWLLVLWSALGAGATSIYLQTLGQSKASSSEAQIYYSTTPIWSAILALMFMGETMGSIGWVGGAGLVIAGLIASLEPF